jgi:hypothetical protein
MLHAKCFACLCCYLKQEHLLDNAWQLLFQNICTKNILCRITVFLMGVLDRVQSCPLNMQYHLHLEKHSFLLVLVWVQNVYSSPSFYLIVELGGNNSQGHREVVWGTGQNFPTGPYVIIVKQDYIALYCILSSTDTARIYIIG